MNSDWQAFFSKSRAVHRLHGTGDWFCSGCFRNFVRQCNAALHLKQNSLCRNSFSMIFTVKGDKQDPNIPKNAEIEKPEQKVPVEKIVNPVFLHSDREEVKDEIDGEINEKKIVRATRLGKKTGVLVILSGFMIGAWLERPSQITLASVPFQGLARNSGESRRRLYIVGCKCGKRQKLRSVGLRQGKREVASRFRHMFLQEPKL